MRSCLVLGSGRSGTSMVAGALASAGWNMAADLFAPRAANPKGFFEAPEINGINEALLAPVLRPAPSLGDGQRWLGIPRDGATVAATPELERRIRRAVQAESFCHKDPRFAFTLPAWRPHLPADAGLVAVFRDPRKTARSMLEEARSAHYLRGVRFDEDDALALWTAVYRAILDARAEGGDWCVVHYDQVLAGDGLQRLARFLGAPLDTGFPDRALRRAEVAGDLPPEARTVYTELCTAARFRPDATTVVAGADVPGPRVAVVALVAPDEHAAIPRMVEAVRAQRGVDAELVLVDVGADDFRADAPGPIAPVDGARVVRAAGVGRGRALRDALATIDAEVVALLDPACEPLPAWLARSLGALKGEADLVTCDYWLADAQGQFTDRAHPAAMGDAPGPLWHGGLVGRRSAWERIETTAFRRNELGLWRALRAEGRVAHVEEPGFAAPHALWRERWEASRREASLVTLDARAHAGDAPDLSVSICTFQRRATLAECLEAFATQVLPRGAYELVITNDGSDDGTDELLERIEFPVPATVVTQANGGLSAARNAGLPHCRGELVLFVNDDTIPRPDCVERHVRAHRASGPDARLAVLGTFEQPADALCNALVRYLETSTEIFDFGRLVAGRAYDGMHFYTCNVSVAVEAVRAAGAFDEAFRHYGCEDTDLGIRLEELGFRVRYEPRARALHRHFVDFDYLAKRQRQVARAYVRFYAKHPHTLDRWDVGHQTAESCRRAWLQHEAALPQLEAAARELSKIDVGALEALGGTHAAVAKSVVQRLGALVRSLNRLWWWQGYEAGFQEQGLAGFPELASESTNATEHDRARCDAWAAARPAREPAAPELSVVVPTRDRPEALRRLCEALAGQDLDADRFELIVVDDGSAVPASAVLGGLPNGLAPTVLRAAGRGPGPARNLGVSRARGDVVVFLNDDAVPRADCLRRHLEAHRGASEARVVQGAFPLLPQHRVDSFAVLVETTTLLFAQPAMKAGVLYQGLALCTGNVSLPRAALEAVCGFDESLPFAGGEDSELGLRLERELGLRVQYDPTAVCGHDHLQDVRQYARRQRVLGWSLVQIGFKHGDASLVTGDASVPLDDAFARALLEDVEARRDELPRALAAVEKLCAVERARRQGPRAPRKLEPLVKRVGEIELRRGMLAALAEVDPARLLDEPFALAPAAGHAA